MFYSRTTRGGFIFATDQVMHRPIARNPQPFTTLYFPYFLCRKAPDAKYPIRIKKLCTLPCVCMYRSDKREKSFPRVQFGIFDQIISFRLSLPLLPVSRKKGKTRSEHKKTFKVACADTTSKTQPVVWETVARVLKNFAHPKIKLEVKGKVGFFSK